MITKVTEVKEIQVKVGKYKAVTKKGAVAALTQIEYPNLLTLGDIEEYITFLQEVLEAMKQSENKDKCNRSGKGFIYNEERDRALGF